MKACCKLLDDYFDNDLEPVAVQTFLESAKDCIDCVEAIKQQAELDHEIRRGWQAVQTSWPKKSLLKDFVLTGNGKEDSSRVDSRSHAGWIALVVAAVLLIGVGLTQVNWKTESLPVSVSPNDNVRSQAGGHDPNAPSSDDETHAGSIQQTVVSVQSSKQIVLPIESTDDYTLVRVFQTNDD